MDIRLIRNKDELVGTCYFEFVPGEYQGRCWNDGSVFLEEGVFGYLEPVIQRNEPRFDHYSFVGVRGHACDCIIADLRSLAEKAEAANRMGDLNGEIGLLFGSEEEFAQDFRVNANALAGLARELAAWLSEQRSRHECVSILGM
jgi:hypothetical protein